MRDHRFRTFAAVIALACTAVQSTSMAAQASTIRIPFAPANDCFWNSQTVPDPGSITNLGSVGIGVVHLADGTCTHGTYDVILPVNEDTYHNIGWNEVSAAYVGSGFKVAWYWKEGGITRVGNGPCYVPNVDGGNLVVGAVPITNSSAKPVATDAIPASAGVCVNTGT